MSGPCPFSALFQLSGLSWSRLFLLRALCMNLCLPGRPACGSDCLSDGPFYRLQHLNVPVMVREYPGVSRPGYVWQGLWHDGALRLLLRLWSQG